MNKKKMIFIVFLGLLAVIVLFIAVAMMSSTNDNNKTKISTNNFKIWILEDSKDDFMSFLENFKKDTNNKSFTAQVESFNNYEEYNMALSSAIIKGEAPDLYMLNNNEKSIFLENAIGIDPEIISPDDLRSSFFPFYGDDLILSSGDEDNKTEFLVGIPFGFETLGLYVNLRRIFDTKKLSSFSEMENVISEFHEKRPELVALGIGAGNTVNNVSEIFTQFLMSENISSINEINSNIIKSVFSKYFDFSSNSNNYYRVNNILNKQGKNNLDYFADGEIAMIFGYPRLLRKIDDLGFSKGRLQVVNFPDFINDSNKLVNYNYFVLNKNSQNKEMGYELLKYIFSEAGEKSYLEKYKYYIPARKSLYSDFKDNEIIENYHIKLKNFYNPEAIYSSFDKGLKSVFDKEVIGLLDNEVNYLRRAGDFVSSLKCKTLKVIKLENLSQTCE